MYDLYLDGVLYPVAPSKVTVKTGNQNKTVTLINEGEVNIIKGAGLKEVSFDLLLPNSKYPFAVYPNGYRNAEYYINLLQALKDNKKNFQFILSRKTPQGNNLYNTDITVSLEDLQFTDDAKEGLDVKASITLKEYKHYGTKKITIANETVTIEETRTPSANAPSAGDYTVVKGDTLWAIAKKFYSDGSQYGKIANANADKISNPNLIYPGQVLKIPDANAPATTATTPQTIKISKSTGGSKTNPPYSIITSDFTAVQSNLPRWGEAYGYYQRHGGKDRKWKILDGDNCVVSL